MSAFITSKAFVTSHTMGGVKKGEARQIVIGYKRQNQGKIRRMRRQGLKK